jgi:hypothetical protein
MSGNWSLTATECTSLTAKTAARWRPSARSASCLNTLRSATEPIDDTSTGKLMEGDRRDPARRIRADHSIERQTSALLAFVALLGLSVDYRYRRTMSQSDPNAVDLEELKRVLEEVLTIAAIDRSRFTWRTAEGIAEETGIPVARVRQILDTTSEADVMQSDKANPQGYELFTTRDHFVKTTGDVSKRYAGVERST